MAKRTMLLQKQMTTTKADDSLTIDVAGKWNLIALEAKYEGTPCNGSAWFEPVERIGVWGSITAIGIVGNNHFCSASNLVWHGKLPLQNDRNNKIIVGLRGGDVAYPFSLSILLEEK